ncbi:LysR substrate-binding domain-containing protein [Streptomyces sp. NPDC057257]|uniref:LysR substrate-binding domain-containing protein n=1 Tax=Streptomyces sp. NPDC057257 TaxID=3346071 RepID=UPI00364599DC
MRRRDRAAVGRRPRSPRRRDRGGAAQGRRGQSRGDGRAAGRLPRRGHRPRTPQGGRSVRRAAPDCQVEVREAQLSDSRASLLDGSVDVLIASYPFDGMARGPVLLRERRVLAVAAGHPPAGEEAVSLEVLAEHPVVQYPEATSVGFKRDRTPDRTPSGRPVPKGPAGGSFSEMLTLVAMGEGVLPVGEHARRYYPRPDVAHVPLHDAPFIERGPVWLEGNTTERVREFVRATADVADTLPAA